MLLFWYYRGVHYFVSTLYCKMHCFIIHFKIILIINNFLQKWNTVFWLGWGHLNRKTGQLGVLRIVLGQFTVPTIPVRTKPVLCTNWPKITMLFYYLKVPKDFRPLGPTLALTGALKWGTVWTSTSNGTGIMKGQSWSCILMNFDLS